MWHNKLDVQDPTTAFRDQSWREALNPSRLKIIYVILWWSGVCLVIVTVQDFSTTLMVRQRVLLVITAVQDGFIGGETTSLCTLV